jgi:hypothetical protein
MRGGKSNVPVYAIKVRELKVELMRIYKITYICKYKVSQQRERFFRIR